MLGNTKATPGCGRGVEQSEDRAVEHTMILQLWES